MTVGVSVGVEVGVLLGVAVGVCVVVAVGVRVTLGVLVDVAVAVFVAVAVLVAVAVAVLVGVLVGVVVAVGVLVGVLVAVGETVLVDVAVGVVVFVGVTVGVRVVVGRGVRVRWSSSSSAQTTPFDRGASPPLTGCAVLHAALAATGLASDIVSDVAPATIGRNIRVGGGGAAARLGLASPASARPTGLTVVTVTRIASARRRKPFDRKRPPTC